MTVYTVWQCDSGCECVHHDTVTVYTVTVGQSGCAFDRIEPNGRHRGHLFDLEQPTSRKANSFLRATTAFELPIPPVITRQRLKIYPDRGSKTGLADIGRLSVSLDPLVSKRHGNVFAANVLKNTLFVSFRVRILPCLIEKPTHASDRPGTKSSAWPFEESQLQW